MPEGTDRCSVRTGRGPLHVAAIQGRLPFPEEKEFRVLHVGGFIGRLIQ